MTACSRSLLGVLTLAASWAMAADAGTTASQPASRVPATRPATVAHVALLEAEYITPDVSAVRRELTGWLDTVLTESLAQQKNLVAVDRQVLAKVLAEKSLAKLDAGTADAAIKPFIASGVLICPTIVADAKTGKATVTVQAVLAQRGTLLAETAIVGEIQGNGWKTVPKLDEPLGQFWQDLRRSLENLGASTLEVRRISLKSDLGRLGYLADDLADALANEPRGGLALLVPRQPVHTKEERLLRLMGLAKPDDADKSSKLTAASDFQLSGELTEQVKPGVPFEQTAIKLAMQLTAAGKELAGTDFAGTVADYPKLRRQSLDWAAAELAKAANLKQQPLDESHAKALAQQELALARRLQAVSYGNGAMNLDRQGRLAMAALRAAHLDPTSEPAAYLVVQSIDGLYESRGQRNTLACWDRLLVECENYLDRFGDRVPEHHCQVLDRIGFAGFRGDGLLRKSPTGTSDITSPPDERRWRYVRAYVLAYLDMGVRAETNKAYRGSNALQSMDGHIRLHLIPSIPDEKLDGEYSFWREFWRTRIAPLGDGKCVPWDCIEMGFAARKKNPKGVREAAQRLAEKYPGSKTEIWHVLRDDTVSLYLHAAGDKEWQTWQPTFAKSSPPRIDGFVRQAFYERLMAPLPSLWDYAGAPEFGAARLDFPSEVTEAGTTNLYIPYPRVQFLLETGKEAWFITPAIRPKKIGNYTDNRLWSVSLDQLDGGKDVAVKARAVAWPVDAKAAKPVDGAAVRCAAVTGDKRNVVWIGTTGQGIARFDETPQGTWDARWLTSRDGMPADTVLGIWTLTKEKMLFLGLSCGRQEDVNGQRRVAYDYLLWTTDASGGSPTVVAKCPYADEADKLRLRWPDGKELPMSLLGRHGLASPEIGKGVELVTGKTAGPGAMTYERADKPTARAWLAGGPTATGLWEVSLETCKPLAQPLGAGPREVSRDLVGTWSLHGRPLPSANPLDNVMSCEGIDDSLWMVQYSCQNGPWQGACYLMVYTPAPAGTKTWQSSDRWLGPMKPPRDGYVWSVAAGESGRVWLTCSSGMFVASTADLIEHATKAGLGCTTAQWREGSPKRVAAAPWRQQVALALAQAKWKDALAVIDCKLAEVGEVKQDSPIAARETWTDAMLYKALVASCSEGLARGLDLYSSLAGDGRLEPSAREHAAFQRINLLRRLERWQEMLEAMAATGRDMAAEERQEYGWGPDIRRARKELNKVASQPSTSGPSTKR